MIFGGFMGNSIPIYYDDLDIKFSIGNIKISVAYLRFTPSIKGWKSTNHSHSSFELHYIPKGKCLLTVNQSKYDIVPGTFYLTGPGIYHEQMTNDEDPMTEYCINFDYSVSKTANLDGVPIEESKGLLNALQKSKFWIESDKHEDNVLFEKIFKELENKQTGYYTVVRCNITQIIINMLRYFTMQNSAYEIPKKTLNDVRRQMLDDLLHNRFRDISIDELACSIGVGVRQFDRIMKQLYNVSFKNKLLEIRLDNAKYLLKNTNLSVDEICNQTGFNSLSYFCRVIKSKTGHTAVEYRNMHL